MKRRRGSAGFLTLSSPLPLAEAILNLFSELLSCQTNNFLIDFLSNTPSTSTVSFDFSYLSRLQLFLVTVITLSTFILSISFQVLTINQTEMSAFPTHSVVVTWLNKGVSSFVFLSSFDPLGELCYSSHFTALS